METTKTLNLHEFRLSNRFQEVWRSWRNTLTAIQGHLFEDYKIDVDLHTVIRVQEDGSLEFSIENFPVTLSGLKISKYCMIVPSDEWRFPSEN